MAKLTYDDKIQMNENANIPAVNKGRAVDWNEIKTVVNTNDDNVGNLSNLNTTEKSNLVGAVNEVNSKLSKITSLWKGEKNTTGSVTLSDEYSNYDLIAFTIASNNTSNRKTEFVWAKDIIINGELDISIFQSSSVWVSVSGTFTSTTDFNIGEFHRQSWSSVYLIAIDGIKF